MPRAADPEGRREQILKAAVKVFGERGYYQATITDVANEAGVAHGTVYLYFHNKAEILQSLHASFAEWLASDLSGPVDGETTETGLAADLYRMFLGALDACSRHRQIAEVCLRERTTADSEVVPELKAVEAWLAERVSERLARAVAKGEARPVRPEFAGDVIFRLLGVAIRRLLMLGPGTDVDLLAREMVDFIMFGVAAEGARNNRADGRVSSRDEDKSEL